MGLKVEIGMKSVRKSQLIEMQLIKTHIAPPYLDNSCATKKEHYG
jgi:hypothetical protein